MTNTIKPESAQQVEEAVAWALSAETALEICGSGSKRGLGNPVSAGHRLDLSGLRGITLYEPEELVLSARAGTPLAEIEAALAEKSQYLAFEPMDYGPLLGQKTGQGTIGGMIACNLAGPRRLKAGAARDHFLGFSGVSGRGEAFKSGGRVVKNVTGYDLMKLMAGSYGTLAVMTDVTVKVLPAPPEEQTLLLSGLTDQVAIEAMSAALQSSCEVSSAAHLSPEVAGALLESGEATTVLRLEGHGPSVAYRAGRLGDLLHSRGEARVLPDQESRSLWRGLRDVAPLAEQSQVWRISVPPARGAEAVQALDLSPRARYYLDWGGGLIWLAAPQAMEVVYVRERIAALGGHATLVRGRPVEEEAFQPLGMGEMTLMQRIKDNFDPEGILNPGRLYSRF